MLLSTRTLILVGSFLIFLLIGLLELYSPAPAGLALAHAQLPGLSTQGGCDTCHGGDDMTKACLACHSEIAQQVHGGKGYHAYLLAGRTPDCASCHQEHHGASFPLVNASSWRAQNPALFRHPQTEFTLAGRHDALACKDCHEGSLASPFALAKFPDVHRKSTFLGLSQKCRSCHEDIHADGLTGPCTSCHGQDSFRPTVGFDHTPLFPLTGGHARLRCGGCHVLPKTHGGAGAEPFPYPFGEVKGKTCEECHQSPHRVAFHEPCQKCHGGDAPEWTAAQELMSAQAHARTGFHLEPPHADVPCAKCHDPRLPYDERHPDPSEPGYLRYETTCQGCHEDVHRGQFAGRHKGCLDCHDKLHFDPPAFGLAKHARLFPLTGAHAAAKCGACHETDAATGVRKFAGTPHPCKSCHENPHGDQFQKELAKGDCTACHNDLADTFELRRFDHLARTGYALRGAHAKTGCDGCHLEVSMPQGSTTVIARRYRGTSQECQSCHQDVHRGQAQEYGACDSCHTSFDKWGAIAFDHTGRTQFPLEGAHARAACKSCHIPARLRNGDEFLPFKPLAHECGDCHDINR